MAVTKMQISPVIVNGFENGFHQWSECIFLVVVEAKNIGFELLCLEVGTSVASALTAETVFEIIKCMSDVDMPARVRMGSNLPWCDILLSISEQTLQK